jgi:lysophospholipid acyltransferase (LPLAT)-like uncharacterized protein
MANPRAFKAWVLASAGALALKALGWTWRIREVDGEGKTPFNEPGSNFIYAFWHSQLLPACRHYHHPRIRVMVSRNFDGELIAQAMMKLGYPEPVRGSSSRGGAAALKALADRVKEGDWAVIFPDGPRGPRHEAQEGVLTLSKLTGRPIIPVGFHARPAFRLKTWDRLLVPLPFSRGTFVFGGPIQVPADCGREEQDRLRLKLQEDLNALTHRAGGE